MSGILNKNCQENVRNVRKIHIVKTVDTLVEQVVSTVKKRHHSPWRSAEVCRSHCQHNIQRFLLSLWQLFCWCIAEANWKILKSPQHFIADVVSTWISKAAQYIMQEQLHHLKHDFVICLWVIFITHVYENNILRTHEK